jgi:hypothetical protein
MHLERSINGRGQWPNIVRSEVGQIPDLRGAGLEIREPSWAHVRAAQAQIFQTSSTQVSTGRRGMTFISIDIQRQAGS